jgi:hypothetical protein
LTIATCHQQLSADNNITTGKIYQSVIQRERAGEYLGKTVQVCTYIRMPYCCEQIVNKKEKEPFLPVFAGIKLANDRERLFLFFICICAY